MRRGDGISFGLYVQHVNGAPECGEDTMPNKPAAANQQPSASPLHIMAATYEFMSALTEATGMLDIPATHVRLLLCLYTMGELNQQDLGKLIGTKKTSNSRTIQRLGEGEHPLIKRGPGWVSSYDDPSNRQRKLVSLTPLGRALLDRVAREVGHYFVPRTITPS